MKSVAVVAAIGGLLLAGCTSGTPEPATPPDNGVAVLAATEILDRATQALAAAKSYHLSGAFTGSDGYVTVDLKRSGENLLGEMTMDGKKIEALVVDGQKFVRLDKNFLTMAMGEDLAEQFAPIMTKNWLKPPVDGATFGELTDLFEVKEMIKPKGALSKGEASISSQRPVIALLDSGNTFESVLVATTGEPLPVKVTYPGGGLMVFTDFGADFPEIKLPAANEFLQIPATKK
ncbi:hypothetical protein [Actinoplanes palleronii]|uniref:Lipoprotein LprG n=1 Tax=Actinoplanes palleronii TaxID=113570 RepID=A0ABQ4BTB6_9ACTN|nr:hypothetical protein [Actinoplanes palleronii]GIE73926.1 hypothetical protein Apa02nite_100340 [Actinoplanes palleronii]